MHLFKLSPETCKRYWGTLGKSQITDCHMVFPDWEIPAARYLGNSPSPGVVRISTSYSSTRGIIFTDENSNITAQQNLNAVPEWWMVL